MPRVEIYTTKMCPYCVRAKQLLERKGVTYDEHHISFHDADAMDKMIKRAGGQRTVPQIFINDRHVGGCDDLYALDQAGKLDGILHS